MAKRSDRSLPIVTIMLGAAVLTACVPVTTVNGLCGTGDQAGTCAGSLRVPAKAAATYRAATRAAIDTVRSAGFRRDLDRLLADRAALGKAASAWPASLTADTIVAGLGAGLAAVRVDTLREPGALFRHLVFGTKAMEGAGTGPILVNPHYRGTDADYANTLVHEAAHRAPLRLSHPHYANGDNAAGLCEPPYLIGSLVERRVSGKALDPRWHCAWAVALGAPD